MKKLPIIVLAILLTGCAAHPNDIEAISAPPKKFSGLSCPQLLQQKSATNESYVALRERQLETRQADTAGLLLVGLSVGGLSGGDKQKEIAIAKGEIAEIDVAIATKKCK